MEEPPHPLWVYHRPRRQPEQVVGLFFGTFTAILLEFDRPTESVFIRGGSSAQFADISGDNWKLLPEINIKSEFEKTFSNSTSDKRLINLYDTGQAIIDDIYDFNIAKCLMSLD